MSVRVSFATEPGSALIPNEDAVTTSARIVVVADGVTAPPGLPTGCVHGTSWYVSQLGAHIVSHDATTPTADLRSVLADALSSVAASHRKTCDLSTEGTPSATIAILRTGSETLDYLVLSDATIVLDTDTETRVLTDDRLDGLLDDLRQAVKAAPAGSAQREAGLAALVTAQRKLRNVEGGYWLAGATARAAEHALTGSIPLIHVRCAAAMTDGAARLVDMFHAMTWPEAIAALRSVGPGGWIHRLRSIEATDAALTKWPRYKQSDDAALAVFELDQMRCS